MKRLSLTLLICLFILSPNVVLSETWDDLVEREGIYYKRFTDVPFSGKVTGEWQGSLKNGKEEGLWVYYYQSGTVAKGFTETYKDGRKISD